MSSLSSLSSWEKVSVFFFFFFFVVVGEKAAGLWTEGRCKGGREGRWEDGRERFLRNALSTVCFLRVVADAGRVGDNSKQTSK